MSDGGTLHSIIAGLSSNGGIQNELRSFYNGGPAEGVLKEVTLHLQHDEMFQDSLDQLCDMDIQVGVMP